MADDEGTHVPTRARERLEPARANLWQKADHAEWKPEPLIDGALLRRCTLEPLSFTQPAEDALSADAVIYSARDDRWALLTRSPRLRVNGRAPIGGLVELEDRDEIRTDAGARVYFCTQLHPVVEPFPHDEPAKCPRCFKSVKLGEPSVSCSHCAAFFHQGAKLCFTYADTCPVCGHRTSLDGSYEWSPAVLDGCEP